MKATINYYLGYTLAALMGIMTLDVLWGVFTRYALGSQADWSEELARFLLMWIGLLGAAYAAGQHKHLAIDLLLVSLPPRRRRRLQLFIYGLIIVFVLSVMVVGGLRLMYVTQTLGQLSAALRVPMYWIYAVVPVSGLLVAYYKLYDIAQLWQHPDNSFPNRD